MAVKNKTRSNKRPKKQVRKISLRVPVEIDDAWRAAAEKAELSLTDFIRNQVEVDGVAPVPVKKKTPVPKIKYKPVDPVLLDEINRIGNNLNQLTQYCHTFKYGADSLRIVPWIVSIENEIKALREKQ